VGYVTCTTSFTFISCFKSMETCRIGAPDAAALDVDELGTDAAVSVDQTSSLTAEASARAGGHDGSRGERRQDANGTRRRQREELAYLRERAAALEQELALLRADCLDEVARDPVDAVVSPSPWERIAARQREARRNAEKENDRLRRDVEAQLRLAKSLERLLRKRPGLGVSIGIGEC
jgi:cell division septum initiation protein DivIVA